MISIRIFKNVEKGTYIKHAKSDLLKWNVKVKENKKGLLFRNLELLVFREGFKNVSD